MSDEQEQSKTPRTDVAREDFWRRRHSAGGANIDDAFNIAVALELENRQLREELSKLQNIQRVADNQTEAIVDYEQQLTSYKQGVRELLDNLKALHAPIVFLHGECEACKTITRAEQLLKEG